MAGVIYDRERRSSRIFKRVRVVAAGKNDDGRRFRQGCETIVINAYGCLLCIPQQMEMGSLLTLTNPFTQHEEQECRVVYLGEELDKGWRVGVEFLTPAPRFWGIDFTQPVPSTAPFAPPN
jgi:hypothetical protein